MEDWQQVKELRLAALRDPVAGIAFLDTYDNATAQPDEFWQERAAGSRGEMIAQQFIAERADGRWDGSVTVLIERADRGDVLGQPTDVDQAHLVGVFVRPEQRGTGLARALFDAAIAFAHELDEPKVSRVRLYVHQDNAWMTSRTVSSPAATSRRSPVHGFRRPVGRECWTPLWSTAG